MGRLGMLLYGMSCASRVCWTSGMSCIGGIGSFFCFVFCKELVS